jgi:hypothetical protein
MTIAAGMLYKDGVLLCADTQFTVGLQKLDGMKLGKFAASWGQVVGASPEMWTMRRRHSNAAKGRANRYRQESRPWNPWKAY